MTKRSHVQPRSAACTALLAAAFATLGAAQEGDDADEADVPREPRSCLNQSEIARTTILNDRNIVFVTRFDEIYNSQLPKQCPGLRRNALVNYPITNRRLCAGDRFAVLWEQQPGNYLPTSQCPLGMFVPITATELEDLLTMTDENRDRDHRPRGRSKREAVTTEQIELPPTEPQPEANDGAATE
jgi:hypothetical protein